jgi:uncharacterized membrane protein YgcG
VIRRLERAGSTAVAMVCVALCGGLLAACGSSPSPERAQVAKTRQVAQRTDVSVSDLGSTSVRRRARTVGQPLANSPSQAGRRRSAETFVRRFYTDIDARSFDTAWGRLPSSARAESGSQASWRDGYSTTVETRLSGVNVALSASSATVRLTLRATDIDACAETVRQRFTTTWTLQRDRQRWRATAISARKISGRTPRQDPSECPSAAKSHSSVPDPVTDASASTESADFCQTHSCIPNYPNGHGTTVMCSDGNYSHSGGLPGACSHHGGVSGGGSDDGSSTSTIPGAYSPSSPSGGGTVHVRGYTRKDGTYVAPYTRRAPCSYC